jgi:hypothetical protein
MHITAKSLLMASPTLPRNQSWQRKRKTGQITISVFVDCLLVIWRLFDNQSAGNRAYKLSKGRARYPDTGRQSAGTTQAHHISAWSLAMRAGAAAAHCAALPE